MGKIVASRLGMVLSAVGLLTSLSAQGGGGWSKAVANYLYPPLVNRLSDGVHSYSCDPVFSGEPVNIPSASSIVNDRGEGSLKITALPNELVVNILANLSIRDLLVCKHVCKNWYGLVTTVPALACAAYRSCHPAGHVPRLNDASNSYRGSTRQWLNGFSKQGRKAVARLDGILESDGAHFPEQLFFAIARVLDETPAFHCRKVYTTKHPGPVNGACFSPDQQYLFSYSDQAGYISRFVDGGWEHMDTLVEPVSSAYFSADSRYLVVQCEYEEARIWALADGQWQQQADWVPCSYCYFSPSLNADSTHLVTISGRKAKIHSLIDGLWRAQATAIDGHRVWQAVFHPKEPDLLATRYDNVVTFWRSVDGRWQEDGEFLHTNTVSGICFSPNGDRLTISGIFDRPSGGRCSQVLHRVGREWQKETKLPMDDFSDVAHFSPRGNYIFLPYNQIWGLSGSRWEEIRISRSENVYRGCFSPDEYYLVTQDSMGNIIMWSCINGLQREEAVIPCCAELGPVSFGPHGSHFIAAKNTKNPVIWGVSAGRWQQKATLPHTSQLTTIGFSPFGNYVLTTTQNSTVTVWSLNRQ